MKRLAILLILTAMIGGCGNNSSDVQTAAGGVWQAQLLGGDNTPGFSFITQFSVVGSGGTLTFTSFQFLTQGPCFPVNGETPSGTMALTVNTSNDQVTGPFTFSVAANGNTLALNGTVTGTENGIYGTTLSNATVTGTWTLTGGGSAGCTSTDGSFTMTQAVSGTT